MEKNNFPICNFIEYSNQIRLIYTFNNIPLGCRTDSVIWEENTSETRFFLLKFVCATLTECLKDFGAEEQSILKYYRVPGSINTKNKSTVKIIDNTDNKKLKKKSINWKICSIGLIVIKK